MTKIRKQKRKKKFRANVNRKRLRNKLQKLPKIECEDIEKSWETKRSIRTNLKDMGLAYNPNEVLKIPSNKRGIIKISKQGKGVVKNNIIGEEPVDEENDEGENNNVQRDKIHVVNKLEADAKAPRERMFRLPKSQVYFITYLMDKYGDDYKAMARDRKNYYQMTWCQIRAKINTFKSIPEQYAEYLLKTGEIVLDDPTPLEETRRKLGEENVKKYCAPKKRKLPKESTKHVWEVESVENENDEFDTKEKNASYDQHEINKSRFDSQGLKKLKLFSEDESDNEETNGTYKTKRKTKTKSSQLKEKEDKKLVKKETDEKSLPVKQRSKKGDNLKKDATGSLQKLRKIQKSQSSDSDSEDEKLEGENGEADGFINLSDMSEEGLSEDDVLDDGEFITDSEDESN